MKHLILLLIYHTEHKIQQELDQAHEPDPAFTKQLAYCYSRLCVGVSPFPCHVNRSSSSGKAVTFGTGCS